MPDGGPKLQLAVYAVAAILLVVAAVRFLDGRGDASSAAAPITVDGGPNAAPDDGAGGRRQLYVHVAGAVRRPGLYRVAEGSRVAAAVHRAGGLSRRADLTLVNLAAPLEDGQQVVVPRRGATAATGATAAAGSATAPGAAGAVPAAPVSLATATPDQLDALDGIGPTLAARIIEYRDARRLSLDRRAARGGRHRRQALRVAQPGSDALTGGSLLPPWPRLSPRALRFAASVASCGAIPATRDSRRWLPAWRSPRCGSRRS